LPVSDGQRRVSSFCFLHLPEQISYRLVLRSHTILSRYLPASEMPTVHKILSYPWPASLFQHADNLLFCPGQRLKRMNREEKKVLKKDQNMNSKTALKET